MKEKKQRSYPSPHLGILDGGFRSRDARAPDVDVMQPAVPGTHPSVLSLQVHFSTLRMNASEPRIT